MNNHDNNRVLSRIGARQLTPEEIEYVTGGIVFHTNVCTLATTHAGDGDGCGNDLDHGI